MKTIKNFYELEEPQRRDALLLLEDTVRIHEQEWHKTDFTRRYRDTMSWLRSAINLKTNWFPCLVVDGVVASVLFTSHELISEGPYAGMIVRGFLWCDTKKVFRGKGLTFLFHSKVVNALVRTGDFFIPVTVDSGNFAALKLAEKLAMAYPGIVRVESHDKRTMMVTVSVSNGKEMAEEWRQKHTVP